MARPTFKVGRSAITGRFTSIKKARRYNKTHVVETIRKPTNRKGK